MNIFTVKRIELIDIAKGISIILVAFTHTELRQILPELNDAMALFRMPLFFFLSGIFFRFSEKFSFFIQKKSDELLKPYFFTLGSVLIITVFFKNSDFFKQLLGIFYGNGETIRWIPLWFLTHLWLVYFLAYLLFRFFHFQERNFIIKIVILILLLIVGFKTIHLFWQRPVMIFGETYLLPGLPFSMDIAPISLFFFISGSSLKKNIIRFIPKKGMVILSFFVFAAVVMFTRAYINLNKRIYVESFYATLGALSGIYLILSVSYLINKNKIMTLIFKYIGASSLFILIFHSYIASSFYNYFAKYFEGSYIYLIAVISFIMSFTVPLLIREVISKTAFLRIFYFPIFNRKAIVNNA